MRATTSHCWPSSSASRPRRSRPEPSPTPGRGRWERRVAPPSGRPRRAGARRRRRRASMASSAGATDDGAALARSQARAILAERRFHSTPIPRPLHGVLHAVGKALEAPLHAVDEVVSKLGVHTPGGSTVVWAILAAFVLAISGALAARGSRRALSDPAALAARGGAAQPIRARDLEREAETAARAGRHADAVRLRFRAGLMRLAESERIQGAP